MLGENHSWLQYDANTVDRPKHTDTGSSSRKEQLIYLWLVSHISLIASMVDAWSAKAKEQHPEDVSWWQDLTTLAKEMTHDVLSVTESSECLVLVSGCSRVCGNETADQHILLLGGRQIDRRRVVAIVTEVVGRTSPTILHHHCSTSNSPHHDCHCQWHHYCCLS